MAKAYRSPARRNVNSVLQKGKDAFLKTNPYGNQAQQEAVARPNGLILPQDQTKKGDKRSFQGKVTLTFDDGPSLESTPQVLDILKKHGIQATFFVHGERVSSAEAEALLQRMRDEGHIVANHSMKHSMDEDNREVATTAAGETADIIAPYQDPTHPTFFRAPGGNGDSKTLSNLEGYVPEGKEDPLGLAAVGWHGETNDWCYDDKKFGGEGICDRVKDAGRRKDLVANVLHDAGKYEGGIMLFHDNRQYTADHLDEIITALKEAKIDGIEDGYQFTNLDDEQAYPRLNAYAQQLNPQPYEWRDTIDAMERDVHGDISGLKGDVARLLSTLPAPGQWLRDQSLETLRADATVFPFLSLPALSFPSVEYDSLSVYATFAETAYKQFDKVMAGASAEGLQLGGASEKDEKDEKDEKGP
jgi:peptidoglycan/xylan/chitin deacetylase (PgdA/CDA1 family)